MKKEFAIYKIVTTNKEHECAVCSQGIPKGTKTINHSGYGLASEPPGYFNEYCHLERSKGCYLDFMEALWMNSPEEKLILENVIQDIPLNPKSWEVTLRERST